MDIINEHYFFRLGSRNKIFDKNYRFDPQGHKIYDLMDSNKFCYEIYLAVFYKNFTYHEYVSARAKHKDNKKRIYRALAKLKPNEYSQVVNFFEAKEGAVFWIFLPRHLLAFRAKGGIIDYTEIGQRGVKYRESDEPNKTMPKLRIFDFLGAFDRFLVPEIFSTTDASNIQGTLLKLPHVSTADKFQNAVVADALLTDAKINLAEPFEALKFLSPVQLETFFFKLFDSNDLVVSSCRGGSRYQVDLVVLPSSKNRKLGPFKFSRDRSLKIQIKRTIKKIDAEEFLSENSDVSLICLNELPQLQSVSDRLVDGSLIKEMLKERWAQPANNWMKHVLQQSKIIKIKF